MPKAMLSARIQDDLFDALESISTESQNKTFHVEKALNLYQPIKKALKPRKVELEIPEGINLNAWNEWVDFRKNEKRKAVSKAAAKKQFKLLLGYTLEQQQQIIDSSIQNDYQGLFALKGAPPARQGNSFVATHTNDDWRKGL
ncbi:MAG: hypothetical protein ACYS6K_29660 [Planctomycetota bacterium]